MDKLLSESLSRPLAGGEDVEMGQSHTKRWVSMKPAPRTRLVSERGGAWGRAGGGEKVMSCSFERWLSYSSTQDCRFQDLADYATRREDFRANGFLLRPDVTDGR